MDKLADNLQRLPEDDLLQVVQMIYDNKSSESWTKNDIDGGSVNHRHASLLTQIIAGEFQVDLCTLPDSLVQMLWSFSEERAMA